MLDFATVLRAPVFKFLVGKDGDCFNVPTTLAKGISQPLYTLMSGGQMKEAKEGVAILKEVESETFTAFCEYAYTGSYRVPKVTVDFDQPTEEPNSGHSPAPCPTPSVEDDEVTSPLETMDELVPPIHAEEQLWISSPKMSKKDKKKGLRSIPEFTWAQEMPQVQMTRKSDFDIIKDYHHHLWNEFCNLNYDPIPEEFQETLENLHKTAEVEFKPLLFHCKLYVFAHMYLMVSLRQLTLQKLHAALKGFDLDLKSSDEVLEAIEFAFANTERGDDADEDLRKVLVAYAASKTKILKRNVAFRTLLDAHGELGSDIIQVLG